MSEKLSQLGLKIPESLYEEFKQSAKKQGVTTTELLISIIKQYLNKNGNEPNLCPKCHFKNPNDAKICHWCGTGLDGKEVTLDDYLNEIQVIIDNCTDQVNSWETIKQIVLLAKERGGPEITQSVLNMIKTINKNNL